MKNPNSQNSKNPEESIINTNKSVRGDSFLTGDLFSTLSFKKTTFKNRTVMSPMVANSADTDGSVTRSYHDFYLARARGGVGYIVLGGVFVHEDGRGFNRQLGIHNDRMEKGLKGLTDAVRRHCHIGAQLSLKSVGRPPENFSLNEIKIFRQALIDGAARALSFGFDAVELHACHDYWLNYFLSPHFNHRTDEYGGSLKNRFRLLKETVTGIQERVGSDLLLGVRLSLEDFVPGGLGLKETLEVGRRLEAMGVDYLSASVGIGLTQYRMSPPMEVPRSSQLMLARTLKQTVNLPVIGAGRLDRPAEFREAVEGGHVSLAATARALIADPEFVLKIQEGRESEIRPCLACNHCLTCLHRAEEVRCVVNPLIGRDLLEPSPVSRTGRVMVVGGGPAGLTAAAYAARRGAKVDLYDKNNDLGGTLNIAAKPPFKEPLRDLAVYLTGEAERAGVEFHLGEEVDADTVLAAGAGEVVLAVGARPIIPGLKTLDSTYVTMAEDILKSEKVEPGRYLVIGGGLVGLETAEFLVERGAEVVAAEMLTELGKELGPMRRALILDRLTKAGANLLTEAKILSIEGRMVLAELSGAPVVLGPFTAVIMAAGYKSDSRLAQALEGNVKIKTIGDGRQARSILEAIQEGLEYARELP